MSLKVSTVLGFLFVAMTAVFSQDGFSRNYGWHDADNNGYYACYEVTSRGHRVERVATGWCSSTYAWGDMDGDGTWVCYLATPSLRPVEKVATGWCSGTSNHLYGRRNGGRNGGGRSRDRFIDSNLWSVVEETTEDGQVFYSAQVENDSDSKVRVSCSQDSPEPYMSFVPEEVFGGELKAAMEKGLDIVVVANTGRSEVTMSDWFLRQGDDLLMINVTPLSEAFIGNLRAGMNLRLVVSSFEGDHKVETIGQIRFSLQKSKNTLNELAEKCQPVDEEPEIPPYF